MKLLAVTVLIVALSAIAWTDEDVAPTKFKTEEHSATATRDKLIDKLFTNYKNYNYPDNATVEFGVSLLNVDFDTDHDIMNSNIWIKSSWTDSRFSWDPVAEGISVLRIPADKIWLPDVVLYNGIQPKIECFKTNAIIYPNGKVIWVPPCSLKSYCNLNLEKNPYGEQECSLRFGSWTFDGLTIGLEFFGNITKADTDYFSSGKYQITQNAAVRNERIYDCCVEPYISLTYSFVFKRFSATGCESQAQAD